MIYINIHTYYMLHIHTYIHIYVCIYIYIYIYIRKICKENKLFCLHYTPVSRRWFEFKNGALQTITNITRSIVN